MKKNLRRLYVTPSMEIIPMATGCVMATLPTSNPTGSSTAPSAPGGGNFTGTSAASRATSRDLDNLINDILTVGQ
jgi:hypothetical protein